MYGDIITARGFGDIAMTVDKQNELNLAGKYTIDEGDYLFTLGLERFENLVNKRFVIANGSTINWYGDPYNADIDIDALIKFHKGHGKMVTVSAVHPGARFGELDIDGDKVSTFKEKPQTTQGWINGGYFVIEPDFFNLIDGDSTILEKAPLEKAAELGELMAYRHDGFWQCMDTKRDRDSLEGMWQTGAPPWIV